MDPRDGISTLPAAVRAGGPQPRILVVEHDRHVRALLCDLLAAWGYEVDAASNGREGLARFDPGLYHMVLTDLAMPEVSGLDVAATVREQDPWVGLIVFTGGRRELAREGRRLGFRVVHKPLAIDGLRRVVRESLPPTRPL